MGCPMVVPMWGRRSISPSIPVAWMLVMSTAWPRSPTFLRAHAVRDVLPVFPSWCRRRRSIRRSSGQRG
eukprot:196238-Pyramimonas_sp.AAC.1